MPLAHTAISRQGDQACNDSPPPLRHINVMTPFTDRAGRFSALKTATFTLLLLPALWVVWRYFTDDLGPLPIKEVLHVAGLWALRFLIVVLALTPAQRFLGLGRLALVRRMVGLGAASYAGAHVVLYIAMQHFDLGTVVSEIVHRRYLTLGFIAVLGLSLLAATSTDGAIRRLGQRWKTLHRAVYAITALGLLHFFMQAKIDVSSAVFLAGLFLLLMAYRVALRRKPVVPAIALAVAAVAAGAATAVVEGLWYGLASGVSPWRVAAANFTVSHGLRPAVLVLATGLAAVLFIVLKDALRSPKDRRIMACFGSAAVLDKRPASARSSAG